MKLRDCIRFYNLYNIIKMQDILSYKTKTKLKNRIIVFKIRASKF